MTNENDRAEAVANAQYDILSVLEDYNTDIWGDALGAAIASILTAKTDAAQIAEEEAAKRRIQE